MVTLRSSSRLAAATVASSPHSVHVKAVQNNATAAAKPQRKRARHSSPVQAAVETTQAAASSQDIQVRDGDAVPAKKRKRRKIETIYKPDDFLARADSKWKVGPHVSAAGGVENTIINAASIGATAFALFVKSQRKWSSRDLTSESIANFKSRMVDFGYSPEDILPHGSYLVNLGNPDKQKREKSFECFVDDLKRCEQLGLSLYNFHPGSTVGQATPDESCSLIAECVNRAHKETNSVVIVLENMAGAGNIIGSKFEQLGLIINEVVDKTRVGVCLDTCHMFAAGYDIRTKEGWHRTMEEFDAAVGLKYLRGMHLNDSKAGLGSKKDRHENIGLGELGLSTFSYILADPRTQGIPLILETPAFDGPGSGLTEGMEVWAKEVEVLNQLSEHSGDKPKEWVGNLDKWNVEIRDVVGAAKKKKDAKSVKGAAKKTGGKRVKKKQVGGGDESEEGDNCCSASEPGERE